ncbi:hypothetical protein [Arsenophonus apicola]|uniref:hypothetical protein n=1 Tax=Arsenophonus apicola TaxID=2879119 RepID=UPI0024782B04|nr:hypothetical protein [Arsenophonus apicola]
MPRIAKSELDELKCTVSLLLLVKLQGHTVKKTGQVQCAALSVPRRKHALDGD